MGDSVFGGEGEVFSIHMSREVVTGVCVSRAYEDEVRLSLIF